MHEKLKGKRCYYLHPVGNCVGSGKNDCAGLYICCKSPSAQGHYIILSMRYSGTASIYLDLIDLAFILLGKQITMCYRKFAFTSERQPLFIKLSALLGRTTALCQLRIG